MIASVSNRSSTFSSSRACRSRACILASVLGLVSLVDAAPREIAQERPLPEGTVIEISADASAWSEDWATVLVSIVDSTSMSIGAGWDAANRVAEPLVSSDNAWIHLVASDPKDWLHGRRWQDPARIADRLRMAGARPLGGGRFELDGGAMVARLWEDWVLIQPARSGWRPAIATRLETSGRHGDGIGPRIEACFAHASPTDGMTRIELVPAGKRTAEVRVRGRYASNPLGSGVVGPIDREMIAALEDRFAFAVVESGVGVVGPRLVELALEIPELVPPPMLRRVLEPRRILVVDSVQGIGGLAVPAVGLAVPLDLESIDPEIAISLVDDWLIAVHLALWRRWNEGEDPPGCDDGGRGVRHRTLGPGLLTAMDRHPIALGASLNWAVRAEPGATRGWLVLGTDDGVVGDLLAGTARAESEGDSVSRALVGVARPARLGDQVREFADVRRWDVDADSVPDAALLTRLAEALSRLERVEWSVEARTDTDLDATVLIERRPEGSAMEASP